MSNGVKPKPGHEKLWRVDENRVQGGSIGVESVRLQGVARNH